jgi:hypothetical protein
VCYAFLWLCELLVQVVTLRHFSYLSVCCGAIGAFVAVLLPVGELVFIYLGTPCDAIFSAWPADICCYLDWGYVYLYTCASTIGRHLPVCTFALDAAPLFR